jgi:hypothetical protein
VHRDFEQDGDRSALGPVIHLLIDDGSSVRHLRNTTGSSDHWNVDQSACVNEPSRTEAPVRNASVKRINVERTGQCETDFVTSETTDIWLQLWDKGKPQTQVQG